MSSISKIDNIPIRDAFPHEAYDFTVWLSENIEALSERVGLELTVLEREKSVGSFTVDLFCEDRSGETVIIENQLEQTDHDHLGKLLTYLVNLDARRAIWIATDIQQEHLRVIDWLNESTSPDMAFYAVKVEAIRIDDSPYAPMFTVLTQPDEQTRQIGQEKKELAEGQQLREEFWTRLIERSLEYTDMLQGRTPGKAFYYTVGAGKGGCHFTFLIYTDHAGIELYIDTGNRDENKQIFDILYDEKEVIEDEFDFPIEWQRLDEKQACRLLHEIYNQGSLYEKEKWDDLQELLIKRMIRLDETLRKRLKRISI